MVTNASHVAMLLGLSTFGLCQGIFDRADYVIARVPLAADKSIAAYQRFFDEIKDMGTYPLSAEGRALRLSDQELRLLLKTTADLATQSRAFEKEVRPARFEAIMEVAESGTVTPFTQQQLQDLENRWGEIILRHVQQLKTEYGEARFRILNDFIHSEKSMYLKPRRQ